MTKRLLLGTLALLLCAVAFTTPADAVNIPGCGEFVAVASDRLILESGPTEIFGNLIVTGPNGFMEIGRFNVIHGTISANTIQFGNDAKVDGDPLTPAGLCEFNNSSGVDPTTVCDAIAPFVFPTCVPDSFFTAPTVDPCVDTAANFVVAANSTDSLADGACVGLLKLNNGATLNVTGTINVKQIQLGTATRILGPAAGATINVKQGASGGSGGTFANLRVNFAGTADGAVVLGNNFRYDNTLIFVPVGGVHLRANSLFLNNSEVVGRRVILEPIRNEDQPDLACPCVRDFVQVGTTITLEGEEFIFQGVPIVANVLATLGNCDPSAGLAVAGFTIDSAQQITVDVSNLNSGTYKLITTYAVGQTLGSCCTAKTFTIP